MTAAGELRFGDETIEFSGRGERDHSWGPRLWNLEWIFLAVSSDAVRLQCAEARVPNAGRFAVGYLQRETTVSVFDVELDLRFEDDSLDRHRALCHRGGHQQRADFNPIGNDGYFAAADFFNAFDRNRRAAGVRNTRAALIKMFG